MEHSQCDAGVSRVTFAVWVLSTDNYLRVDLAQWQRQRTDSNVYCSKVSVWSDYATSGGGSTLGSVRVGRYVKCITI